MDIDPLSEYEIDREATRDIPPAATRFGLTELLLLDRTAAELGLTRARLIRRLTVRGLLDIEKGSL